MIKKDNFQLSFFIFYSLGYLDIFSPNTYNSNYKVPKRSWEVDVMSELNDNLTLLRLLHQCAHRINMSSKYPGQGRATCVIA